MHSLHTYIEKGSVSIEFVNSFDFPYSIRYYLQIIYYTFMYCMNEDKFPSQSDLNTDQFLRVDSRYSFLQ